MADFRVGRNLVLGPGQMMQVPPPYILQNLEATVFQDYVVNRNVNVWEKQGPTAYV